jgi:hypothetical protein
MGKILGGIFSRFLVPIDMSTGIKAHLLEDKQISSVRVYDEAKNDPFLGGHLSPNPTLFDQILP